MAIETWEVVQVKEACYLCGWRPVEGTEVTTVSIPIPVRWPKQRKKLKANTHMTFMACAKCAREREAR